jgi:DNA-binding winged helix-turn-helix (wHTH) protein
MHYRFGECGLDTASREFLRGRDHVHLSPKAFDLLRLLIEQRPRVVSKVELMQALWPDTFVVEGNLPVIVAEVRSAIGDRVLATATIKTHHGIGYSFAVAAQELRSSPARASRGGRVSLKIGERRIELAQGANLVGRDAECDVEVPDASVSRSHARITLTGQSATVVDLGSTNRTRVNGKIVDAPVELRDGDELTFGQVFAKFLVARRTSNSTLKL